MTNLVVQKPRKEFLKDSEISGMGDNLWITRKYRGFTGVAKVENGSVEIFSGNGVSTYELPHLQFSYDGIYIGEIYTPKVEDENNLQEALNNKIYEEVKFAIYDVLAFKGDDLSSKCLRTRKAYIGANTNTYIHAAEETDLRTREELLTQILSNGWEGIVAADLRGMHKLNTGTNGKRQRGLAWKLKPSLHLDLIVTENKCGVLNVVNPADKSGHIYKLGSFRDTLNPDQIRQGDIVEVSFCSIDRDGNLVHPVVTTLKS